MVGEVTRDEVRLGLEASEARTDTKLAGLDGKLDLLITRLDDLKTGLQTLRDEGRSDNRATRSNILVVGFGLAGLIVAVAAGLPSVFAMGTQLRDLVAKEVATLPPAAAK